MSKEPIAREAMRVAEQGTSADASRLVASVPELMREARRRRAEADSPALGRVASWAMPRLAAATLLVVVVATSVQLWERSHAVPAATTFESVILGGDGDGTGDIVFDALLGMGRRDG